jgi:ACS family pantothenate transporter-like MFS transporter
MVKHHSRASSGYSLLVCYHSFFHIRILTAADGAMGIPFGIFSLMFFLNLPKSTNAPYLSQEEIQLALDRLPPKRDWGHGISLKSLAKRLFARPGVYILTFYSMIGSVPEVCTGSNRAARPVPTMDEGQHRGISVLCDYDVPSRYSGRLYRFEYPCWLCYRHDQSTHTDGDPSWGAPASCGHTAAHTKPLERWNVLHILPGWHIVHREPIIYGWASVVIQRGGDDASRSVILYIMSMVQSMVSCILSGVSRCIRRRMLRIGGRATSRWFS